MIGENNGEALPNMQATQGEEAMQSNKPNATEENSLDLHLDISLPALPQSPDRRIAIGSPSKEERAGALLMTDERELLKDLQCFDEPASSDSPKDTGQKKPLQAPHSSFAMQRCADTSLSQFEDQRLETAPDVAGPSLNDQQVQEVAYDSVGSG